MAEADELITWLGFKFKPDARQNIQDAQRSLDMIKEGARKIGTFFMGAGGAIGYFTNNVMKGAQEISDMSKRMGISTDELQKWKYVAEASGQSFDGLVGDLQQFKKVGIDAISLSGKLAGMNSKIALQYKDRFGISDDMFYVLRQGPAKVKELMQEAYVIPNDSIEQTAKFNKQLNAAKSNLIAMKNEIFMAVSPTLVELTKKFKDWMEVNKEWIKTKLVNVIEGVALGFKRFVDIAGKALDYLVEIAKQFGIISDDSPQVESVAKVVTAALLIWSGAKVIGGLTTLFTLLKGIFGLFAATTAIDGIAFSIGALTIKIMALTAALAELKVIFDSLGVLGDFKTKGVDQTIEDIKKKHKEGKGTNIAEKAVLIVEDIALGSPALKSKRNIGIHYETPPQNQTNNTNSGNTINIQMTPQQASTFVREVTGGEATVNVTDFAFGPNVQP